MYTTRPAQCLSMPQIQHLESARKEELHNRAKARKEVARIYSSMSLLDGGRSSDCNVFPAEKSSGSCDAANVQID
jgi:hypothetical protein